MYVPRKTPFCPEQVCFCVGLMSLGCTHAQTHAPAPKARVAQHLVVPTMHPPAPPQEAPAVLVFSQSVRDKCELPPTNGDSAQHDFDDAMLRPRGEDLLDRIAACMRDGSLRAQSVRVIGHAGPRGFANYDSDLGMERARSARDYLLKQGVAESAVEVGSRLDQGGPTEHWQLDRRVEIEESEPHR